MLTCSCARFTLREAAHARAVAAAWLAEYIGDGVDPFFGGRVRARRDVDPRRWLARDLAVLEAVGCVPLGYAGLTGEG